MEPKPMTRWRASKRSKFVLVLLVLACLLLALRIALPYWLKSSVNNAIADLPNYGGGIADVDVALWRSSYQIHGLTIDKLDGGTAAPFLIVEELDLSLQWKALIRGRIVGEVVAYRPHVTFYQSEESEQLGKDVHWTKTLADLLPISINRFEVVDGRVDYARLEDDEVGDLSALDVDLLATNLRNVIDTKEALPSSFRLRARLLDLIPLEARGRINPMEEVPSMTGELSCENIDLPKLNDFAQQFLNLDFESGTLNLYSEWTVEEGVLEGYLKFLGMDIEVVDLEDDAGNPFRMAWEAIAGLFVQTVENQKRDQFATKVPFSGELQNVETDTFSAIMTLLRNGFVEALNPGVDNTIQFGGGGGRNAEKEK